MDHTNELRARHPTPATGRRPSRWRRHVGALAALALTWPLMAHAGCQIESLELPVRMVGSRAVATVGINGTMLPLTVDSGAFYSVLTEAAAAQLKLPLKQAFNLRVYGITGRMDAQVTTVDKLQLLKGDIDRVQFVVGGNEPGAGTMGLLGRNILSFTDTEYDLAHGVIRFLFPNDDCRKASMAYWAGSSPVTEVALKSDERSKTPALRFAVKLNGKEFTALLDSGASTIVSERAARRAGIAEADMKGSGTLMGVGSGSARASTAAFERFEIGGESVLNNRLIVGDLDLGNADMLLGIDFFLSHRIYVSKSRSMMFITYNGGPVFALDRRGTGAAPDAGATAGGAAPTTADEFARRGAASAARNDYRSALADLDRACGLDPTSAALLAQRGVIHEALRQRVKALEDFDNALRLDPAQPDAHYRRAVLRFNAKDLDGAQADLDALDRTLPSQAQMRLPLARFYLNLDQPAKALAQLDQWLPAHPNEVTRGNALSSRCWARVVQGVNLDRALDDCNDAVDSDPKNPGYHESRGWAYFRLGKYQRALEDFDLSLEASPLNAWTLYGRGLTKTKLGDAVGGDADLAAARKASVDIDARVARIGMDVAGTR